MNSCRFALFSAAAALLAFPALAQSPPTKPATPLEKAISDLNQVYSGLNGNINALGVTANDIRDHQIATVQAAIGTVLAEKTKEDADKLAALKTQDDAALAAAKKVSDAKIADLTKQRDATQKHLADAERLAAQQHQADQALIIAARKPREPPMCINGPLSPKQYQQFPHSVPAHH